MPFPPSLSQASYPALYLYPLNDSFVPKHVSLLPNQRVKIGRQTNAKTVPGERNGYFDSKVLSRQHAEVWEDGGKIFIKDVKSSNGTFINGERLSGEGLESDPFELKTDDVVEFGIDIVGEDNKTIIHHKVAARVVCVLSEQDMQLAARAEAQHPSSYGGLAGQPGQPGAFNFAPGHPGSVSGSAGPQRRSTMQQGLVGMGGMGAGARAPGKSGLTFDHILSRLQGELQKSRETGQDLHTLSGAMNDIHETLGGNLPPNIAPFPQTLPPVVPPQPNQPTDSHQPGPPLPPQDSASALAELQAQLHETQMSLASHVEKIRALEGMLAEHEAIKHEVGTMRDMMEERKREMELLRLRSQSPTQLRRHPSHMDEGSEDESADDDDARSVATLVMHELERVEEEDEEQIAAEEEEEERRRRRDELGRPRTPEPTGMGMHEDDDEHASRSHDPSTEASHLRPPSPSSTISNAAPSPSPATVIPDDLLQRMTTLSNQLESALELSRSLEAQHQNAQSTISVLESKVIALESLVQSTQSQVQAQGEVQQQLARALEAKRSEESPPPALSLSVWEEERARDRESLTSMLNEWKKSVEGQWTGVREEWSDERERLRRAKEDFESRVRNMEDTIGTTTTKVETGLASMASFQLQHQIPQANGSAKINGLVTPPSPRSLSSAATRPRQRKRRPSSSRGRSRSRSTSPLPTSVDTIDDSPVSPSHDHDDASSTSSHLQHRSPWLTDDSSDCDHLESTLKLGEPQVQKGAPGMYPTPDPSLLDQPVSGLSSSASTVVAEAQTKGPPKEFQPQFQSLSTIVGVVVLSVAAAAVIWRVKPEGGV